MVALQNSNVQGVMAAKTAPTKHRPEKGGRKPGSPEFAGVCRSIPRSILAPEHLAKTLARVENRSQLVK